MGNLTSQLPTIFWILNSENFASNPSFCTMRAYLRDASLESSSDFAPVTTIFPDAKINAVVFGSRMRIITAAKRYARINAKGEQGSPGFTYTSKKNRNTNLGVIFCIPCVQRNCLKVETAIEIDSRNNILQSWDNAFDSSDMLLLQGKRSRSGRYGCRSRG